MWRLKGTWKDKVTAKVELCGPDWEIFWCESYTLHEVNKIIIRVLLFEMSDKKKKKKKKIGKDRKHWEAKY